MFSPTKWKLRFEKLAPSVKDGGGGASDKFTFGSPAQAPWKAALETVHIGVGELLESVPLCEMVVRDKTFLEESLTPQTDR